MKIQIENKDKPKTNYWKYHEKRCTNKSNKTHEQIKWNPNKPIKNQIEPIEKPTTFVDLDLVEREN